MEIMYDVETCSENYKKYIRSAKYGDTISKTTKENMIFIYNEKKYIIRFCLEFSFDFENSFNYTYFSDFKCNRKIEENVMNKFISCVKKEFISTDRLSL